MDRTVRLTRRSTVVIVVLLSLAAVQILVVKAIAERAAAAELSVAEMMSEARRQNALEWCAIADPSVPPPHAEIAESRERVIALGARARAQGLPEGRALDLGRAQRDYWAAVTIEFSLLKSGDPEKARRWYDEHVAQASDRWLEELQDAASLMRARSDRLSTLTDVGVVAVVLTFFVLIVVVQARAERVVAKHAHERLAEARYREIIDGSRDLVFVCDAPGRVNYLSPAAARALGVDAGAESPASGLRITDLFSGEQRTSLVAMLDDCMQDGVASGVDLHLRDSEGGVATYEFSARDLRTSAAVGGIVITGYDVTRRMELERAKSEFVATVSHELRTPLTSIRGYLELLASASFGPLSTKQTQAFNVVHRNASRLLALVDDLLLLSGVEAGRSRVHTPVDLGEMLSQLVSEWRALFPGRVIELYLSEDGDRPEVMGDADDLDRVLGNLVGNAMKFSPSDAPVQVCVEARGGRVWVRVVDQGIGIPAAAQRDLFRRFFRAENARHDAIPGTGLGLALCKELVSAHDGTLVVDSVEGVGTTVTMSLPGIQGAQRSRAASAASSSVEAPWLAS